MSASPQFTTLALTLVEEGKLALDTTIHWPVTGAETAMPRVTLLPVSEWEVLVVDGQGGVVGFIPGPDGRARYFRTGRILTRVE